MSVSTLKWIGDGSVMRFAFERRAEESDSEEELYSEEQEVSLLPLLLLLSLRFRDFDRPLPLLLLEDLRLEDPCDDDDGDKRLFPDIDAGDLGGRWLEAIVFKVFELKEYDGEDSTLVDVLIVKLEKFIVA